MQKFAEAREGFVSATNEAKSSFADDRVFYAYDRLPKGNYRFVFRTRALIAGTLTAALSLWFQMIHGCCSCRNSLTRISRA